MTKHFVISLFVLALASGSVSGADQFWTAATGDWNDVANWGAGLGAVPTGTERAFLDSGTAQITSATPLFREFAMRDDGFGPGTVEMTGGTFNVFEQVFLRGNATDVATFNQSSGTSNFGTFFIADGANENAVMNLTGDALLLATGNLLPGGRGDSTTFGTLNISDNARARPNNFSSADDPGVHGTVNIFDNGLLETISGQLSLGEEGDNITNVSGNGELKSAAHIYVNNKEGTTVLNLMSGQVNATDGLYIGRNFDNFFPASTSNGTMNMTGGTASAAVLGIGMGGTGHLQLDGGFMTIDHSLVMNVNGGIGSLDITGGTLSLPGIWNTASEHFSTGDVTAYGGAGTFVFTEIDEGEGIFTTTIAAIPGGFDPADLNMDGFVDGLDLGILLGNWDTTTTPDMGELDGTPPVDGLDLGILLGAWNPPPLGGVSAVPEPTTALLVLMGWAGIMAGRRR